jgi:hypothetical protein
VTWSSNSVNVSGPLTASYSHTTPFSRCIGSGPYMKNLPDIAAASMLTRRRSAPTKTKCSSMWKWK